MNPEAFRLLAALIGILLQGLEQRANGGSRLGAHGTQGAGGVEAFGQQRDLPWAELAGLDHHRATGGQRPGS